MTAARAAFEDAGLEREPFNRDRTAVVIGMAGGRMEKEEELHLRLQLRFLERALERSLDAHGIEGNRARALLSEFREEYLRGLVEVTEDTFAGTCPNVIAGRLANFFDLHGANYAIDAACASSLAAVDSGMDALRSGEADLVLSGGVHANMGLAIFIGFSKFHGLSAHRVSPFDETADGFLLGEGAGLFLLKRLDDALRDGNRIVAVLRGRARRATGARRASARRIPGRRRWPCSGPSTPRAIRPGRCSSWRRTARAPPWGIPRSSTPRSRSSGRTWLPDSASPSPR